MLRILVFCLVVLRNKFNHINYIRLNDALSFLAFVQEAFVISTNASKVHKEDKGVGFQDLVRGSK